MRLLLTRAVLFIVFLVLAGVAGAQDSWTRVHSHGTGFSWVDANIEHGHPPTTHIVFAPCDEPGPGGYEIEMAWVVIPPSWSKQAIRANVMFNTATNPEVIPPGTNFQFRLILVEMVNWGIIAQEFSPTFPPPEYMGHPSYVAFDWTSDFSSVEPGGYYWLGITRICDHPDDTYDEEIYIQTVLLEFSNDYPAPVTPTFNDVGAGHWAYGHIEALSASGITAGCGSGNYCPNKTVTRDQMAVFLSKALGLYIP
jgi:hypothetical protein